MRLALIADTFPPEKNSGAVQLRDLSRELTRQGHALTVMLPASDIDEAWRLTEIDGTQVLRLRAPRTRDTGYVHRTLAELAMPFAMLRGLRKSPLADQRFDGVIWYSPSIFHGPLVSALKRASGCKSYLIIRDIFPEWAADVGLMRRGVAFRFFSAIARYQYAVADVIGVQTEGNLEYFAQWAANDSDRTLQVLPNWLGHPGRAPCSIRIEDTPLAGRKIFVYAGNMGVAQNMDTVVELASRLRDRSDVGFLLVGRGSEVGRLKREAVSRKLNNLLFFDEIDPDEIPDLYNQCFAGIVSLDPRHRSHNIPGKFLTYIQNGLPVLANVNLGNDLATMVRNLKIGEVSENGGAEELSTMAERLLTSRKDVLEMAERCRQLFRRRFAVAATVRDIVSHFEA